MSVILMNKVEEFVGRLTDCDFESEWSHARKLIKEEYSEEIKKFISALWKAIDKNMSIIITMDRDFDGYASARALYYFIKLLGVSDRYIEILPLSTLHTLEQEQEVRNSLILISDTSYGNVKFKCKDCITVWIDHHEIKTLNLIKARSYVGDKGIFINSVKSQEEFIRGLSCGAFLYLFITSVIEEMRLTPENEQMLTQDFDRYCRQEALLSLLSDEMEVERYPGLIKGIYDSHKSLMYEHMKGNFDYNNRKYFKRHIAKINNLIRMERFEILEKILKEDITHDMVMEITRIEEDKKIITNRYFPICKPTHSVCSEESTLEFYQLPLAKNSVMKNFKGLMASMKIPPKGAFVIFSYYREGGRLYFSCRHNINIELKDYIKDSEVIPIEIGGHPKAFGFIIEEDRFDYLIQLMEKAPMEERKDTGTLIKYPNVREDFKTICNIALYNEFNSKQVKLHFNKRDFVNISEEPRRTLYEINLNNGQYLGVVSFDVNTIKSEIIAKPQLKQGLYDLDKIEIGEF